jgi:hypothetical protein
MPPGDYLVMLSGEPPSIKSSEVTHQSVFYYVSAAAVTLAAAVSARVKTIG